MGKTAVRVTVSVAVMLREDRLYLSLAARLAGVTLYSVVLSFPSLCSLEFYLCLAKPCQNACSTSVAVFSRHSLTCELHFFRCIILTCRLREPSDLFVCAESLPAVESRSLGLNTYRPLPAHKPPLPAPTVPYRPLPVHTPPYRPLPAPTALYRAPPPIA